MALVEVKVPDIGDFKDVAVIELLVKPGDTVKVEQSLITVESDKASMEIPSSAAGVVKEVKVKLGDTVNEGSVVVLLEGEGAGAAAANAEAPVGGSEVVPGASQASAAARPLSNSCHRNTGSVRSLVPAPRSRSTSSPSMRCTRSASTRANKGLR